MNRAARNKTAPASFSFSGHETFVFRYGWLKKAIDAVTRNPRAMSTEDAMVQLGVGKNMVRSIRHWAIATRVVAEVAGTRGAELATTRFGKWLLGTDGRDPYLENPNSLWLLHWNLSTNEPKATTWAWAFNAFPGNEFTRESIVAFLESEARRRNARAVSDLSLRRDVDCFIRTYISSRAARGIVPEESLDCPLVELNIIEEERKSGVCRFRRGMQSSLSDEAFLFSLLQFWNRIPQKRETLGFSEVAYGVGSPGSVFKLDENSIVERLERVERKTRGAITYAETAGLKQLYRQGSVDPFALLDRQYEQTALAVVGA